MDLLPLIHFLVMFNNDKPSDWLLLNLVHTKVCRFDKSAVSHLCFPPRRALSCAD